MRTVSEIENEMGDCEKEIEALKKRFKELGLEKTELEYGKLFPVGRRLLLRGSKYEICGYKFDYSGEVLMCKVKKDGNLGSARSLHSWDFNEAALLET